jgi:hypothetical protein
MNSIGFYARHWMFTGKSGPWIIMFTDGIVSFIAFSAGFQFYCDVVDGITEQ